MKSFLARARVITKIELPGTPPPTNAVLAPSQGLSAAACF
jgi:hypothetical protein